MFAGLFDEEKKNAEAIEIGPDGISLDLLRAVYRNTAIPLSVRMRAAGMAIKYECPALIATSIVSEGSWVEVLERRIQRYEQRMKLIEQSPNPSSTLPSGAEPTDSRIPPPVPDRRWRRI